MQKLLAKRYAATVMVALMLTAGAAFAAAPCACGSRMADCCGASEAKPVETAPSCHAAPEPVASEPSCHDSAITADSALSKSLAEISRLEGRNCCTANSDDRAASTKALSVTARAQHFGKLPLAAAAHTGPTPVDAVIALQNGSDRWSTNIHAPPPRAIYLTISSFLI